MTWGNPFTPSTIPIPFRTVLALRDLETPIESPNYQGIERRSPLFLTQWTGQELIGLGHGSLLHYWEVPGLNDPIWTDTGDRPLQSDGMVLLVFFSMTLSLWINRQQCALSPGLYLGRSCRINSRTCWEVSQPRLYHQDWLSIPSSAIAVWTPLPNYLYQSNATS
jgi:hypothetical protein